MFSLDTEKNYYLPSQSAKTKENIFSLRRNIESILSRLMSSIVSL